MQDISSLAEIVAEGEPIFDRAFASLWSLVLGIWTVGFVWITMDWSLEGPELWRGLSLAVAMGVFYGLFFVLAMHLSGAPTARIDEVYRLERIFAGDPALIPPPPAGATHRLLCSVIIGKGRASGAALYVVEDGLRLVSLHPRRPFWRRGAPQAQEELAIGPPSAVTLALGRWELQWWQRVLFRQQAPIVLLIEWLGQSIGLRAARASEAQLRLQKCLDELRARTSRN